MVGVFEEGIPLTTTTTLDEKLLLPVAVEIHDEFPREGIIDGGTYGYSMIWSSPSQPVERFYHPRPRLSR